MKKYKTIILLFLLILIISFPVKGYNLGRTYVQDDHFIHIVTQGDTFYSLAKRFQVDLNLLQNLNPNLRAENLQIGDKLKININENLNYHHVQKGDTLWHIGRIYNYSLNHLIEYNKLINPDKLNVKEVILLPHAEEKTTRSVLYFLKYTDLDSFLIAEERQVPIKRNFYQGIMENLIKRPIKRTDGFMPIPANTKVLSLTVSNNIATVNFSEEIKATNVGGAGEALLIQAITNTLTEYREIKAVRILINGEEGKSIAGHIELDTLFYRDLSQLKY